MTYDVHWWADTFIESLRLTPAQADPPRLCVGEALTALIHDLAAAPKLLVLCDYDGTLVPHAGLPSRAAPDAELLTLLRAVAERPDTSVQVISGRSREALERWLGGLPIGLHAENGFWQRPTPDGPWVALCEAHSGWKGAVRPVLEDFSSRSPGSFIEEKTVSLVWHYRLADPEFGAILAKELRLNLAGLSGLGELEVAAGAKNVEIRLRGVHKGVVVPALLAASSPPPVVLALGNERANEDLFAALPPEGISVHVGQGPSRARYRVRDHRAARALLRALVDGTGLVSPQLR
jgi:trehalose 6-phosphate synthase/phosphatase